MESCKNSVTFFESQTLISAKYPIHLNQMKLRVTISLTALSILLFISCSTKEKTQIKTQDELATIIEGNERFMSNHPVHPDQTLNRLRSLEKGQKPFAVVISCSDSRVPPELIFDQGFGDLFIIRNAGNIIGDYELGSVEYAVEHLHTPLVIVMGHSNCGAIGAYLEHQHDSIPNHIQKIVDYIKAEPEEKDVDKNDENIYETSIKANVLHGVHVLQNSDPVIKALLKKKEVKIIGAVYDMHSGKVNFLENEK